MNGTNARETGRGSCASARVAECGSATGTRRAGHRTGAGASSLRCSGLDMASTAAPPQECWSSDRGRRRRVGVGAVRRIGVGSIGLGNCRDDGAARPFLEVRGARGREPAETSRERAMRTRGAPMASARASAKTLSVFHGMAKKEVSR